MKVYEIRAFGGEYELAWDEHVAAYFSKEKAEARLAELNVQRNKNCEQRIECYKCPIYTDPYMDEEKLLKVKAQYPYKACVQKVEVTRDAFDGCIVSTCIDIVCLEDIPDEYYITEFEVEE